MSRCIAQGESSPSSSITALALAKRLLSNSSRLAVNNEYSVSWSDHLRPRIPIASIIKPFGGQVSIVLVHTSLERAEMSTQLNFDMFLCFSC